jgi:hypothetical protein
MKRLRMTTVIRDFSSAAGLLPQKQVKTSDCGEGPAGVQAAVSLVE